jgi:ribosomal protein S12 methylthiotransferase
LTRVSRPEKPSTRNRRPRPPETDPPAISLVALGCPKNLVDSEILLGSLHGAGFRVAAHPEEADLIVVNTCAFLTSAEQESIDTVLRLARLKETGRLRYLVVAGCLPQRHGLSVLEEMPEVDYLLGPGAVDAVADVARGLFSGHLSRGARLDGLDQAKINWQARVLSGQRHAAYLKISEGCSRSCAFCIIPKLRGPHRSRPAEEIVAEAELLGASGVRELTLVAQDTTAYGMDLGDGPSLDRLLERLNRVDGVRWLRLLYTYPGRWNRSLIDAFVRLEKLLPYVDIPIQHAADAVLRRMGRGCDWATTERLLRELRSSVPGMVLRTTVLTGFPGETEEDFEFLLRALRHFEFDHLGAFAFSAEEGTPAAALPDQVAAEVAAERRDRVLLQQREISLRRNRARIGEELEVLVDTVDAERGVAIGRWAGQALEIDGRVLIPLGRRAPGGAGGEKAGFASPVEPGLMTRLRVRGAGPYDLIGLQSRKESLDD